ncbi:MAG: hypothetical protein J2P51_07450, partial [Hyphomicrobiaceae bacterium]|nr:hypothetical protein [Hyphomicrobiaceae bacterium]
SPTPGAWFEATHEGRTERIKLLRTAPLNAAGSAPADETPRTIPGTVPGTTPGAIPPGTILDDALTVACGEGAVRMLEVQRPGRKPMAAKEFLRGFALGTGASLPLPPEEAH